jgi:hypothetical protein
MTAATATNSPAKAAGAEEEVAQPHPDGEPPAGTRAAAERIHDLLEPAEVDPARQRPQGEAGAPGPPHGRQQSERAARPEGRHHPVDAHNGAMQHFFVTEHRRRNRA